MNIPFLGKYSMVVLLCLSGIFVTSFCYAQRHNTDSTIAQKGMANSSQRLKDTIRFRRDVAETHSLVLTDSVLNAIGIDSLLNKVEYVHNTLTEINNITSIGFDTHDIDEHIARVDSNTDIIDENLTIYSNVLDVKNLQMFSILLADIEGQVTDWRTTLFKYNKQLTEMNAQMAAFKRDTVLRSLFADSAFAQLYGDELKDLRSKWKLAKNNISVNLTRINRLQASVSGMYFEDIDLKNRINEMLRKVSIRTMGKEYDYLWDCKKLQQDDKTQANLLVNRSYHGQQKVLNFYFQRNAANQVWMLVTGIFFLFWIFWNYRKIEADRLITGVQPYKFKYLSKIALLPGLLVLFNLAPLYDMHPPTAYVEMVELLLVISLTILLWKKWPKRMFGYWIAIAVLYIAFSVMGSLLTPTFNARILLLLLNLVALVIGTLWFRSIDKDIITFGWLVKTVTAIYIVLNFSAILFNFFGRLSMAKILSVTSVFALTQIIGLTVFIDIVVEALELQAHVNKRTAGLAAKFNYDRIISLCKKGLMILAICIWGMVFSISLNIYNAMSLSISEFLTTQRKIGNTTFEIGNILLFAFIIYISNMLQQGVGSLYGKADEKWDPELKKNGSRLAMTRLFLIVVGFLIAVAASGLPIDKITIVLGALGVGIGLGLQSIVNNLVSGVILIFEQPFRIGDYIELGESKGRVLDIGIRSSKLVMEEGAEIIMPNADLLSGRVINWTLRNDNIRIEFTLSVATDHVFEDVKKVIQAELDANEHVLKTIPSEILLLNITDKTINLKAFVWINDVQKAQSIKSELLHKIYEAFVKNAIKLA